MKRNASAVLASFGRILFAAALLSSFPLKADGPDSKFKFGGLLTLSSPGDDLRKTETGFGGALFVEKSLSSSLSGRARVDYAAHGAKGLYVDPKYKAEVMSVMVDLMLSTAPDRTSSTYGVFCGLGYIMPKYKTTGSVTASDSPNSVGVSLGGQIVFLNRFIVEVRHTKSFGGKIDGDSFDISYSQAGFGVRF